MNLLHAQNLKMFRLLQI